MIQKRTFLSALLPSERLFVLDHRNFYKQCRENTPRAQPLAEVPKRLVAFCLSGDFLFVLFL